MIIKKASWHYRAMEALSIRHSHSLCMYFWQLVLLLPMKVLMMLVMGLALLVSAMFVILPVTSPLIVVIFYSADFSIVMAEDPTIWVDLLGGSVVMGGIVWTVLVVVGIIKLMQMGVRKLAGRTIKVDSEPTLIGEYIKAKKEKVCPRINFVR